MQPMQPMNTRSPKERTIYVTGGRQRNMLPENIMLTFSNPEGKIITATKVRWRKNMKNPIAYV